MTENKDNTPSAGGSILVLNIHINIPLVRLVGENAIDHAAGIAISRPRMTEPNEMMMEFAACLK